MPFLCPLVSMSVGAMSAHDPRGRQAREHGPPTARSACPASSSSPMTISTPASSASTSPASSAILQLRQAIVTRRHLVAPPHLQLPPRCLHRPRLQRPAPRRPSPVPPTAGSTAPSPAGAGVVMIRYVPTKGERLGDLRGAVVGHRLEARHRKRPDDVAILVAQIRQLSIADRSAAGRSAPLLAVTVQPADPLRGHHS